jgi:hypothetical protein
MSNNIGTTHFLLLGLLIFSLYTLSPNGVYEYLEFPMMSHQFSPLSHKSSFHMCLKLSVLNTGFTLHPLLWLTYGLSASPRVRELDVWSQI